MSTVVDIKSLISSIISAQVNAVLEPYKDVLERMNAFIGAPIKVSMAAKSSDPIAPKPEIGPGQTDFWLTPNAVSSVDSSNLVAIEPVTDVTDAKISGQAAERTVAKRRVFPQRTSVSPFSPGQVVEYRQGRGCFEARVISVSDEAEIVTLERLNDGKRIVRPESKVSVSSSAVSQPELPKVAAIKPIVRRSAQSLDSTAAPGALSSITGQSVADLLAVMKSRMTSSQSPAVVAPPAVIAQGTNGVG